MLAKNDYKQRINKPEIEYLARLERTGSSPKGSGLIKAGAVGQDIVASDYMLGKDCAHALAHSLNRLFEIHKVQLKGNHLDAHSSHRILKRLHLKQTRELDMSDNHLDTPGISELSDLIQSEHCCLRLLYLESCGLSTSQVETLSTALTGNASITDLNLARNRIGEAAAVHLGDMLRRNSGLKRLDLHWNNIRAPGALRLLEGFKLNDDLLEIDLSWNSLSQGNSAQLCESLRTWLQSDSHLRHLDLSFNYLSSDLCQAIGAGLSHNHVLIGLHMIGNYCEIDGRGFVKSSERCEKMGNGVILQRILKKKPGVGTKCWICDKWVEITLTISDPKIPTPCFVHFEFEGFQPEMMTKEESKLTITRAVPPGRANFFISTLQGPVESQEFESEQCAKTVEVTYYPGMTVSIPLTQLYWTKTDGPGYTVCSMPSTQPRAPISSYLPPVISIEKPPWTLPISLFATYRFTTSQLLTDAFEFDFQSSKIPRLIKDPHTLSKCKSMLHSVYKYM